MGDTSSHRIGGRRHVVRIVIVLAAAVVALINIAPVLWGVATSVRPAAEIFAFPPSFLPGDLTGEHYAQVLSGSFTRNLANSLIYSTVATVAAVLLGAIAAYAFDRFRFPMRRPLFGVIVACIPLSMGAAVLVIPNYLYFAALGLLDTPVILPLLYLGYNLPMAVWILKGAMEGIPTELDEAAKIDGASRLRTFRSVILPLCKPSLAAASMFVFIGAWNEFVAGSVMVNTSAYRPVQVAVYQFISAFGRQWGPLTASAVLALVPILLLVVFFGRYLVAGLMRGAVKG
ncbi:carbohydrate ABC transporter permease [Occultella gossypii]|uniref:Carbohydrate ABC transporter permease n=1 Tax=Occultella gossypii TaxID=2800820 RepID=A0ABS7S5B4_9MICO|nr:carbohydrate ABC transporter permease [Occultella gossypii]MBZ2195528.1 carbohydrate ABC transporter permease [Occultella gossypii]